MITQAPIRAGKKSKKERCSSVNMGINATGTILPNNTDMLTSAKPLPPGLGAK